MSKKIVGRFLPATWAAIGVTALALSGCAETARLAGNQPANTSPAASEAQAKIFTDLPIPNGAEMNVDKTLVVGTNNWFGQLVLEAKQGASAMFDFYRNGLPQYGWSEITSVRAPVSVLTFERDERILQMQIKGTTLRGSEITVTVSPRGTGGAGGPAPVTKIN